MQGTISKIESMGLKDGPGIRTVIFLQGCKNRCKYCHNPETWTYQKPNMTIEDLVSKILRFKEYYGQDGGITLSGGEPLLQADFIIKLCQELKKYKINIALDTSGVGIGKYQEILQLVDLILLDIKQINDQDYLKLTGQPITEFNKFLEYLNKSKKEVWIRCVIIPNYNDNLTYIYNLANYLKKIKNIQKIQLLPYHNMAISKYHDLNINYEWENIPNMDQVQCQKLEKILYSLLNDKVNHKNY